MSECDVVIMQGKMNGNIDSGDIGKGRRRQKKVIYKRGMNVRWSREKSMELGIQGN